MTDGRANREIGEMAAAGESGAMVASEQVADSGEILRVEDLNLWIVNGRERIHIVHDASFSVRRGERWGIAGESGAGKSMLMKAVAALLPDGSTRMTGRILYRMPDGSWQDLLQIPYAKRSAFVSERVAVIFQDSIHALNPNERIRKQWGDTVRLHHPRVSKEACEQHLLAQMDVFGIHGGAATLSSFPHQLSGGMRQRIAIAMALESQNGFDGETGAEMGQKALVQPSHFGTSVPTPSVPFPADPAADAGETGFGHGGIIIADEPTTSLDSMTQRAVVDYIKQISAAGGKTLLYVSHNLGVLQYVCDKLMVLKDGFIVEQGEADDLYFRAQHPYTRQIVGETLKIMGREAV